MVQSGGSSIDGPVVQTDAGTARRRGVVTSGRGLTEPWAVQGHDGQRWRLGTERRRRDGAECPEAGDGAVAA